MGEHHKRKSADSRRETKFGRAGDTLAPKTPIIRVRRSYSTVTSCPVSMTPFAGGGAIPLEAQRLGLRELRI